MQGYFYSLWKSEIPLSKQFLRIKPASNISIYFHAILYFFAIFLEPYNIKQFDAYHWNYRNSQDAIVRVLRSILNFPGLSNPSWNVVYAIN